MMTFWLMFVVWACAGWLAYGLTIGEFVSSYPTLYSREAFLRAMYPYHNSPFIKDRLDWGIDAHWISVRKLAWTMAIGGIIGLLIALTGGAWRLKVRQVWWRRRSAEQAVAKWIATIPDGENFDRRRFTV